MEENPSNRLKDLKNGRDFNSMNFILRRAEEKDSEFLLNLRNDPEVYKTALNNRPVELAGHKKWFHGKLVNKKSAIYIADINSVPIGQIRFDINENGKVEVDVAVAGPYRGRGYGSSIIKEGSKFFFSEFPMVNSVQAFIKSDNKASIGSFIGAGYKLQGEMDCEGLACVLTILNR